MTFFGPDIRNGLPIGLGSMAGFGRRAFTPSVLFAAGEQGFWYDPTDIPVNWRRNLSNTTDFLTTSSSGATIIPSGTGWSSFFSTGTRSVVTSTVDPARNAFAFSGTVQRSVIAWSFTAVSNTTYTVSFWIEAVSGTPGVVSYATGTLGTGGSTGTVTNPSGVGRVSYTFTTGTGAGSVDVRLGVGASGDATGSVTISGIQVEVGSTASDYQRIVTPEISFLDYQPQPVMYTDSAGTTPVTAVEQAVGLVLDKLRGLVQSQFSTNDNFASGATGWSAQSGWSVGTGSASVNSSAGTTLLRTSATSVAGRAYIISFVVSSYTSGLFRAVAGTAFAGTASATGTYTFIVFSNGGAGAGIWADSTNTVGTITSLSVRELAGNHAIQPGATNRPILRSRYNRLTYSEQFDNAAWGKVGLGTGSAPTVTPNDAIAPDGTLTADLIAFNRGAGNTVGDQSYIVQTPTLGSATYTQTVWIKAATGGDVGKQLALRNAGGSGYGVVTLTANWVQYSRVETGSSGNWELANRGTITTGNSVSAHVWGADFRSANDTYLPYQRIAAATDYDTVGFPVYLAFDGSDDSLYTGGNVDFSATDKMTVWAGVTKLSDAAGGMIFEHGVSGSGTFYLYAPGSADYQWRSGGTLNSNVNSTTFAAPITNVVTGIGDISGDVSTIRVDGAQSNTGSADQGTGNYANAVLNIGRRNNSSLPFNGRLYQLIGRGAATSAALITQAERWVAGKQGRAL